MEGTGQSVMSEAYYLRPRLVERVDVFGADFVVVRFAVLVFGAALAVLDLAVDFGAALLAVLFAVDFVFVLAVLVFGAALVVDLVVVARDVLRAAGREADVRADEPLLAAAVRVRVGVAVRERLAVPDFAAVERLAVLFAVDFAAVDRLVLDFAAVDFAAVDLVAADLLAEAVDVAFFAVEALGSFLLPLTTSLKFVPARKAGTLVFLTFTLSPVRGLRAVRAARARFSNTPKPVMLTFSPLWTVRTMTSVSSSTALEAVFLSPRRSASASTSSALFTV